MSGILRSDDAGLGGMAVLEYIDAGRLRSVPPVKFELSGTIAGPLAVLSVDQIFRLKSEHCGHSFDALYRFPLPGGAVMRHVTVCFGDVEFETELRPRQEAKNVWANGEYHHSLIIAECSPDAFTLQIPHIPPNEDVRITTSYAQLGGPHGIGFAFQIPLAEPSQHIDSTDTGRSHIQLPAPFDLPGLRFSMCLRSAGKGTLSSPSFEIEQNGDEHRLKGGTVVPDRDLELVWTPHQFEDRPMLQIFTDGTIDPCFLALVSPPKSYGEGLPREWTILVDRSMEGSKRQAADRAAERLLTYLLPRDRFNLCLVHSRAAWFADRPLKATVAEVARAISFLQDGEPGGPGLEAALEQALGQRVTNGNVSRHIFIITGTEVKNDDRLSEIMRWESLKPARRRCNVLCISSAPNSYLAWSLAEVGGDPGMSLIFPSQEVDITAALDVVLGVWSQPVVADLCLFSSRRLTGLRSMYIDGTYRSEIGELHSGMSAWVVDRCGEGRAFPRFFLPGCDDGAEMIIVAEGIRALYGVWLINKLETLRSSGADHDVVRSRAHYPGFKMEKAHQDDSRYGGSYAS